MTETTSRRRVLRAVSAGGVTAAFAGCIGLLDDEETGPCEVAERTLEAIANREYEAAVEWLPVAYMADASESDVLAVLEREDPGAEVELHEANCVCEESIEPDEVGWLDDLDAKPTGVETLRVDISADGSGELTDGNAYFLALDIDGEWYVGEIGPRQAGDCRADEDSPVTGAVDIVAGSDETVEVAVTSLGAVDRLLAECDGEVVAEWTSPEVGAVYEVDVSAAPCSDSELQVVATGEGREIVIGTYDNSQ
ncbi:hypothetical protein [Halovivax gelatinilyticus]|uniref:hypothetical protein n=1 Tax=Halovivax gelatinilyticus TaxID=2961597 RepID=UPI0020CA5696|nr:hypothetical protein [Halovivax gelatinilyticus]